jgi:hypothetical protein
VEEVLQDIDTLRQFSGAEAPTVFIGDSNSLVLETKPFVEILQHLYKAFPSAERVTSYARARTLSKKPMDSKPSGKQGSRGSTSDWRQAIPNCLKRSKKGQLRNKWWKERIGLRRQALK